MAAAERRRMVNPQTVTLRSFAVGGRGSFDMYRIGFHSEPSKYYQLSRRKFFSAREAMAYGTRILARWCRMYESSRVALLRGEI